MKKLFSSPYTVMVIVLVMYVIKVIAKIGVGDYVNSPMISGDGYHNIADIFEALLVLGAIYFARLPANDKYPFGRRGIESFLSCVIGVVLCALALKFAIEAVLGLVAWVPSWSEAVNGANPFYRGPVIMGAQYAPWVIGVTAGSAALSFIVSRYQIRIGKSEKHESLVADGEETKSDALIEATVLTGVLAEYFFGEPNIEYIFTAFVAWKIRGTGMEILRRGLEGIMQKSIGKEHEEVITEIVDVMAGVKTHDLKTFRIGPTAVVLMKVKTRSLVQTHELLKQAIVEKVREYLQEHDFGDAEIFIRFGPPKRKQFRIGLPITHRFGHARIAKTLSEADVLRICDVVDGIIERWQDYDALPENIDARPAYVSEKQVRTIYVFSPDQKEERALAQVDVAYAEAPSFIPEEMGC